MRNTSALMALAFDGDRVAAFFRWDVNLARFLSSRLLSCCKCFRLLSRRSTLNRNSKQARNRAGPPRGCSHIRRLRSRYLPTTREQRSAGFVLPFVRQWLSIASASSGGSPVSLRFSAGNKLSDDEAGEKQTSDEVVQRCPVLSVFTNSRSISARDAMLCKGRNSPFQDRAVRRVRARSDPPRHEPSP